MMGAQLVKTRSAVNGILYWLGHDPSSILYLSATKENAENIADKKFLPMFRRPPFRGQFLGRRHKFEFRFRRCSLYHDGGQSPRQAISKTVRRVVLDELDAMKPEVVIRARSRVKTYYGSHKIVTVSSPTSRLGSAIGRSFGSGSQHQLWAPCPHCGKDQVLRFADSIHDRGTFHVKWDVKQRNPELAGRTAWYECMHCRGRIESRDRAGMLDRAKLRAKFPERTQHKSAQVSSLYALQLTFGFFVEKFLRCHPLDADGNVVEGAAPLPDLLKQFVNEDLGELWDEPGQAQTENLIRSHQGLGTDHEFKPGVCPIENPLAIVMYADVQHTGCWYTVVAFGPYETAYLLEYGSVMGLDDLAGVYATDYATRNGQPLRCTIGALDSSDGSMKTPVYGACRKNRWIAGKNFDHSHKGATVWPGRADEPGVRLLNINTTELKDYFLWKMGVTLGSPGAIHLPNQVGGDLIRHWTCERRQEEWTERGLHVEWKQSHHDNHLWDAFLGTLAIARIQRLRQRSSAAPTPGSGPARKPLTMPDGRPFLVTER